MCHFAPALGVARLMVQEGVGFLPVCNAQRLLGTGRAQSYLPCVHRRGRLIGIIQCSDVAGVLGVPKARRTQPQAA